MNRVLILILSIAISGSYQCFSQSVWESNLSTNYDDYITDVIQLDSFYILTASQIRQNGTVHEARSLILKLSLNGGSLDTLKADTFGSNRVYRSLFVHNNSVYVIGAVDVYSDTSKILISKYNKQLILESEKTYSDLRAWDIWIEKRFIIKDSVLTAVGSFKKTQYIRHSFLAKFNLNNLNLEYKEDFPDEHIARQVIINNQGEYKIISMIQAPNNPSMSSSAVFTYNDSLQLLRYDPLPNINYFNPQTIPYKDSLFLLIGMAPVPPVFLRGILLQVLDSSFQTIAPPLGFLFDTTEARPDGHRTLIENKYGDFFVGAQLEDVLSRVPDAGLLIVKLDSQLNTLWQRHIPGNRADHLMTLLDTDDGGVLVASIQKELTSPNPNYYNARLIKLGPNGEITSVVSLSNPKGERIKLYPNPAKDVLNLEYGSFGDLQSLEIYNLQAQRLLLQTGTDLHSINISSLPSGTYLLKATCRNGKVMTEKFVKR